MPLAAALIRTLCAALVVVSRRRPNPRQGGTLLSAFALVAVVVSIVPAVLAGDAPAVTLLVLTPGVALELRADPAGLLFALSASALWVLTSFYSIGYVRTIGSTS